MERAVKRMMMKYPITAGTRQQWQYAYRQFNQKMSARGRERG